MAERRQEHFRRILPIGSELVRRVLDLNAGEGPSRQPPPAVQPPVDRTHRQQRGQEPQPSTSGVVTTPRKHRRRMGVHDQLNIDDYMRELDRDAPRYDTVHDGWTSASEEDISVDEGSGDEYLLPGRREERARESDLDFSGFSGLEEEEEVENAHESDSDGDSEGDGPVRGRGDVVVVVPVVVPVEQGVVVVEVVLALLREVMFRTGGRRIPPLPICTSSRQCRGLLCQCPPLH